MRCAALVLVAAILLAACGDSEDLGETSCGEIVAEENAADMFSFLEEETDADREELEDPKAEGGFLSWFRYWCERDPDQTAEQAFARVESIVGEDPVAAQKYFERVDAGKQKPPK